MEPESKPASIATNKTPLPVRIDASEQEDLTGEDRIGFLRERSDPRFHLYHNLYANYEPPPYTFLRDSEIGLLREWYEEMLRLNLQGETGPALVGVMQTFLAVSGLRRVVQLGHYAGYSTLMLGFALRRMGFDRSLFTADINQKMTEITQGWVDRAALGDTVRVHCGDSASPDTKDAALTYLGGRPEAVLIDSSHQYAHTLSELDLWFDQLIPGGMMFLHDVSDFAAPFDSTRRGGVRRALREWLADREVECIRLNHMLPGLNAKRCYVDGCGLAILQKPYNTPNAKMRTFTALGTALREHWPQHDQPLWGRMTGSLDAMLIGIRARPADQLQQVRNRFVPGTRVRISLAYHAASALESLCCELLIYGAAGPVVEHRTADPIAFEPGMNYLELEIAWPDLPPARRALSFKLSQLEPSATSERVICDCDRGLQMHWAPETSQSSVSSATDPVMRMLRVSNNPGD